MLDNDRSSTYINFSVADSISDVDSEASLTATLTPEEFSEVTVKLREFDRGTDEYSKRFEGDLKNWSYDIEDCKDGTHSEFGHILVEKLISLVEGLVDSRPAIFKDKIDFAEFETETAGNSPETKVDFGSKLTSNLGWIDADWLDCA